MVEKSRGEAADGHSRSASGYSGCGSAIIWDIGCALYAAAICLAGSGISLWFTAKRYDRLSQLSREVDRVLYGNDSMAGIPDEEGELAVLASKIYKMTIRLRDQAEELRTDKAYLQESLADISHQVKTPLTSIHMLLRQLKEEENEQERSRISRSIGSLLARIEWLIAALLKMASLESGTVVLKQELVLAGDVIQKAAEPLAVPMELKGQQLILKGQEGARYTGDFCGQWKRWAIFSKTAWNIHRQAGQLRSAQRRILCIHRYRWRIQARDFQRQI